jgi:hypothetical protein
LHLVTSEDLSWLHALTTPPLRNANARRLHQEGVSEAAAGRGVQAIVRALADEGPLTRGQLRERVAAAGVRTEGQALVHVLMLATLRGLTVRGPMVAGEQAYALVADWLGELAPVSRDRALAELAHRFLAGHGPAGDRDLAKWSGLPLRDARAGLRAISGQLDEHAGGEVTLRRARPAGAELPPPRLLGAFEPALMGWTSREWILGSYTPIVVTGGLFRPFALVDGRAAATWQIRRGQIELTPFAELRPGTEAALHADGRAVLDYLGR